MKIMTLVMVSTFCVFIAFSSADGLKSANIVLYMPFDTPHEDNLIRDQSEYGNDGELIGEAKWTKRGRFGGAIEFDGASRIEIAHTEALNLNQEMTLQVWFKTTTAQSGRFLIYKVHLGAGEKDYEWGLYLTTDSTLVSTYIVEPDHQVRWSNRKGNWDDNAWHFLTGTFDGQALKCYIDGELSDNVVPGKAIRTSEGDVIIGTWHTRFFEGHLDEVRVLNVALTHEEIRNHYENGYLAVDPDDQLTTTWGTIKSAN